MRLKTAVWAATSAPTQLIRKSCPGTTVESPLRDASHGPVGQREGYIPKACGTVTSHVGRREGYIPKACGTVISTVISYYWHRYY